MKHILVLHPVAEYTLNRMLDACERRGWKLSIATIDSSTVGGNGTRLHRWLRVPELNDEPADLLRSVEGLHFDAVVAGNEFAVIAADVLAKELGLVGNDPERIKASRDKRLMREVFAQAGVPQPIVIGTVSSLDEAYALDWSRVVFPVIVKPVNMAMSLFVRLCRSQEEVTENLVRMFNFKKSRLTNYLFTASAIIEEFADGQEYSLECVVEDGAVVALYPTKKFVSQLPSCFEIGHVNSVPFNSDQSVALNQIANGVASSWGLASGIMHVELKVCGTTIKVIEAGCRIAGCHISELVEGRYGVSLEEVLLSHRLGLSARSLIGAPPSEDYFGIRFYFPQSQRLHPAGDALKEVAFHYSPDQPTSGDPFSVNQRLGHCIVASPDHADICEFIGAA